MNLTSFNEDLASFLLVRGPYAWLGYGWVSHERCVCVCVCAGRACVCVLGVCVCAGRVCVLGVRACVCWACVRVLGVRVCAFVCSPSVVVYNS